MADPTIVTSEIGTATHVQQDGKIADTNDKGDTTLSGTDTPLFQDDYDDGDIIIIDGVAYEVDGEPPSQTSITITPGLAADIPDGGVNHYLEGSARDYSTMVSWEADKTGDLTESTGNNTIQKGECYNDSTFTSLLSIHGSTTDATHYMCLTVASGERHDGTKNTGTTIDFCGDTSALQGIHIYVNYTKVEWLELTNKSYDFGILVQFYAENVLISDIIIHDFISTNNIVRGIDARTIGCKIENCQVFNLEGNLQGTLSVSGLVYGLIGKTVVNCTVFNIVNKKPGYTPPGGSYIVGAIGIIIGGVGGYYYTPINCIATDVFEDTTDPAPCFNLQLGWTTAGDYNLSSDTTAPGANPLTNKSASDQFVSITAGSEDLHIRTTADAIGTGIGPNQDSDVPTADIDGDSRSGDTCDMGSDEAGVVTDKWIDGTPLLALGDEDISIRFNKENADVGTNNFIIKSGA